MTNGRNTCQCSFSRSGDPSSGIFRVSCTPQRMIDLASWWTNTRERATISQDICRRLWPTEPWQDYHRNGPTHHICLISAISLYHIRKHIINACTTTSLACTVKTDRLCTWLWRPWCSSVDFWQAWWCGSVEYMHLIMTDALSLWTVSVRHIKDYAYRYMYISSLVVTVMLKCYTMGSHWAVAVYK